MTMRQCKIVDENKNVKYFKDDKLHREDGPALELVSGTKYWYINGKRHRIDGPAIEWVDGHKSWYINDIHYSHEDWLVAVRRLKIKNLLEAIG